MDQNNIECWFQYSLMVRYGLGLSKREWTIMSSFWVSWTDINALVNSSKMSLLSRGNLLHAISIDL